MAQTRPKLITFPMSHYCEKSRWALEYVGIQFDEESHCPGFHKSIASTLPVLILPGEDSLKQSSDIVQYADKHSVNGKTTNSEDTKAKELVQLFDEKLGPATRTAVYFFLLENKDLTMALFAVGVPSFELTVVSLGWFALSFVIRGAMNVNPEGFAQAKKNITETFGEVEKLLADGRPYLAGNSFSSADITFASLAAPVLIPEEFSQISSPSSKFKLAEGHQKLIDECRASAAGQFALRMYKDHRKNL